MKGGLLIAILLAFLCCEVICDYPRDIELRDDYIQTDVINNGDINDNYIKENEVKLNENQNVKQDEINTSKKISQSLNNIKNKIVDIINDFNFTSNPGEVLEQSDKKRSENDEVNMIKINLIEEDRKGSIYEIKRKLVKHIQGPVNDNEGYDGTNHLSATMASTENHFYCSLGNDKERHIILHGTKAWSFPLQDVNLTLSYPTEKTEEYSDSEEDLLYTITGFSVILNIDGSTTKGYITKGGILHDHITITFINTGITSLEYKFWLYGIHKDNTTEINAPKSMYYFCN